MNVRNLPLAIVAVVLAALMGSPAPAQAAADRGQSGRRPGARVQPGRDRRPKQAREQHRAEPGARLHALRRLRQMSPEARRQAVGRWLQQRQGHGPAARAPQARSPRGMRPGANARPNRPGRPGAAMRGPAGRAPQGHGAPGQARRPRPHQFSAPGRAPQGPRPGARGPARAHGSQRPDVRRGLPPGHPSVPGMQRPPQRKAPGRAHGVKPAPGHGKAQAKGHGKSHGKAAKQAHGKVKSPKHGKGKAGAPAHRGKRPSPKPQPRHPKGKPARAQRSLLM